LQSLRCCFAYRDKSERSLLLPPCILGTRACPVLDSRVIDPRIFRDASFDYAAYVIVALRNRRFVHRYYRVSLLRGVDLDGEYSKAHKLIRCFRFCPLGSAAVSASCSKTTEAILSIGRAFCEASEWKLRKKSINLIKHLTTRIGISAGLALFFPCETRWSLMRQQTRTDATIPRRVSLSSS